MSKTFEGPLEPRAGFVVSVTEELPPPRRIFARDDNGLDCGGRGSDAGALKNCAMRWMTGLAISIAIGGCGVAPQPDSIKTVGAFEVPLPSEDDRDRFFRVLSDEAMASGMHVDAATDEDLKQSFQAGGSEMTLHAAVWRGTSKDEEFVANAMDQKAHSGQIWLTFVRGKDPALNTRFREHLMQEVRREWPGTLTLPIMPTGAIPLHSDLVRTSTGYIVNPTEAHRYQLQDPQVH